MHKISLALLAVVGASIAFLTATAVAAGQITIALVPVTEPADLIVLAPGRTATLKFDLAAIPAGVAVQSAVLRVTAVNEEALPQAQFIRIFPSSAGAESIGHLTVASNANEAESMGEGLRAELQSALGSPDKPFELVLSTNSADTQKSYYAGRDAVSKRRPRLIVSWADTDPPVTRIGAQMRYRGNPSDMTPWKNDKRSGAVLSRPLGRFGDKQILAGPVMRGDQILLVARMPSSASPKLYGLGWDGQLRWEPYVLPDLGRSTADWKYMHIDAQNRLLVFANDGHIRVFDFDGDGRPTQRIDTRIGDMLLSKRPVVSAGGMITFLNDDGNVYSLSPYPSWDELWTAGHFGKAAPPVLSPREGDGLVYIVWPGGLQVLDAARGTTRFPAAGAGPAFPAESQLANYRDFHPPFVVEGKDKDKDHDWVFLSAYNEGGGVIEGYTGFAEGHLTGWKHAKSGPISRCIAPPTDIGEQIVYCVQSGQLRGFQRDGTCYCLDSDSNGTLSATSNLIADGDGNIYFWDETAPESGRLYAFDRQCSQLFAQPLEGLPAKTDGSKVTELRVGPNGVLYAVSNTELFAIQMVNPARATLAADTRYTVPGPMWLSSAVVPPTTGPVMLTAIGGKLSFGDFQIPAKANVSCSAGTGISFGAGFAIQRGGALRCSIDAAW